MKQSTKPKPIEAKSKVTKPIVVAAPAPAPAATADAPGRKRRYAERDDFRSLVRAAERESKLNFTPEGHAVNDDALHHGLDRFGNLLTKLAESDKKRTITADMIKRAAALLFQNDDVADTIAAKASKAFNEYVATKGEVDVPKVKKENAKTGPKRLKQ